MGVVMERGSLGKNKTWANREPSINHLYSHLPPPAFALKPTSAQAGGGGSLAAGMGLRARPPRRPQPGTARVGAALEGQGALRARS